MATSKNKAQLNLLKLFLNLDYLSRLIFLTLGIVSFGVALIIAKDIMNRLTSPQLTIAAGDQTGESYIISEAIKKVVERRSNIKIRLAATNGTTQNIQLLEKGEAQLITAQADVAIQEMDTLTSSLVKPSYQMKATGRIVAVLYKDLFQLVVKDQNIRQFVQLKGKTIALTGSGGQFQSFLKIAQHYGLSRKDFKITGLDSNGNAINSYNDQMADIDFRGNRANAIFRVRASGNKSIFDHVNIDGGVLLPIPQAEAMKIKHPAFEKAIIPQGAYRGNPPVPAVDLPTVAVSRLLLASDQVDERVITDLTRLIYEYRQEIANAISPEHAEIKPLISSISRPGNEGSNSIPLHPGALAFYERDKPSFIQEYADYVGLLLTVALLVVEWIRQLKLWIERRKKNEADEYLESAISLMKDDQKKLEDRQSNLDETFNKAASALVEERISQESFRTFNEAYKTTREAIQRDRQLAQEAIEQQQRENSAKYIRTVVKLLQYRQEGKESLLQKLDQVLEQVVSDLVTENISQESFRTFVEAYKTTRDSIERKN